MCEIIKNKIASFHNTLYYPNTSLTCSLQGKIIIENLLRDAPKLQLTLVSINIIFTKSTLSLLPIEKKYYNLKFSCVEFVSCRPLGILKEPLEFFFHESRTQEAFAK